MNELLVADAISLQHCLRCGYLIGIDSVALFRSVEKANLLQRVLCYFSRVVEHLVTGPSQSCLEQEYRPSKAEQGSESFKIGDWLQL